MPVVHKLNDVVIGYTLYAPTGPTGRTLDERGLRVRTQARRNLGGSTGSGPRRVDTGWLLATIYMESRHRNGEPSRRVGSRARYAYWIHEGTGIYGPRHARIFPKRSTYLRWRNRATGKYVYAKSVKGIKPNPFLAKALHAADLRSNLL